MPQNASIATIRELDESDETAWRRFQAAEPSLKSPYFSLDYLKSLDAVHAGVQILRVDEAGRPVGFLPFRRDMFGTARPPDGPLGDLHGLVADPAARVDLAAALRTVSLGGYAYSGVPYSQARHGLVCVEGAGNQTVDISQGYEAYLRERYEVSSSFRRMHRKVSDFLDTPGLTITHEIFDASTFQRLIELKQAGYAEAGHFNVFRLGWPEQLLRRLAQQPTGNVRGVFSMMHMENALVAACFCMRSETVLHYWFPGYEKAYADQKPGHAMLFSLIEWAAAQGLSEVHLGPGEDRYKRQMATFATPLSQGALAVGLRQKALAGLHKWSHRREAAGDRTGAFTAKVSRKLERVAMTGKAGA